MDHYATAALLGNAHQPFSTTVPSSLVLSYPQLKDLRLSSQQNLQSQFSKVSQVAHVKSHLVFDASLQHLHTAGLHLSHLLLILQLHSPLSSQHHLSVLQTLQPLAHQHKTPCYPGEQN